MEWGKTFFLKSAVVIIGIFVLALCVFALPVGLQELSDDGYQPVFVGMYVAAVPFFIALYETMKLLGLIDRGEAFSEFSVLALKRIKQCAIGISALFVAGLPILYLRAQEADAPGILVLGLVVVFASWVIGVFAAVLQKLLKNAIAIKSENDLTV